MSKRGKREGWLIPLCLLIPPIGAAYMWAMQRYSVRTRVLVSMLAALILFTESCFFFSGMAGMPDSTTFTPGSGSVYAPASTTAEPTDVPQATELPYEYVEASTAAPDNNDGNEYAATPDPNTFIPSTAAPVSATFVPSVTVETSGMTEGSQDTVVYTSDGSLFYHSSTNCGDKEYTKAITLQEALNEGLTACNNCKPPESIG